MMSAFPGDTWDIRRVVLLLGASGREIRRNTSKHEPGVAVGIRAAGRGEAAIAPRSIAVPRRSLL
ncbi:hypothetical protein [Protofrankia symbiont of Coriaria ruscifolia]|uniref:Uncharacterized protein n=1 Tax=Candidatus Protofrankia californiensis TaxID=1839754 RepID=A0A1C3P6R6_9ACTN|nr:hypothetical protein [Protofrankia symbiont of Coriaria ruscifolia]SBW25517.1 hypothetical protein FDG2_4575 [Candidatus Protofrankia californiensis]